MVFRKILFLNLPADLGQGLEVDASDPLQPFPEAEAQFHAGGIKGGGAEFQGHEAGHGLLGQFLGQVLHLLGRVSQALPHGQQHQVGLFLEFSDFDFHRGQTGPFPAASPPPSCTTSTPRCRKKRSRNSRGPVSQGPRFQMSAGFRPRPATKAVTIAEFEKTLTENQHAGDAKLAAILSGLTLTERANGWWFSRWSTAFAEKTRQVFVALADGSAFLPLPSEDIPMAEAPSVAEQRRTDRGIRQVSERDSARSAQLSRDAPDLRTLRIRPPRQLSLSTDPNSADLLRNRPLHLLGTSKLKVAYVEGREDTERNGGFGDADLYASRFTTAGEFGPILYGVMMDATQSKLVWARWESSADGPLAVFRFEAPKEKSHYSIKPPGSGKAQKQFVAYRGEIALHPADGEVAWLSIVARPTPEDAGPRHHSM